MTEKVVEDVEDTPVVASGDDTETAAPVGDAPAPAATEDEVPAVESSGDAVEVTENGKGDAEVVEPVVEEAGKFFFLSRSATHSCTMTNFSPFVVRFRRVCKAKSWRRGGSRGAREESQDR